MIKVIYRDSSNVAREETVYAYTDYINSFVSNGGNRPVKTASDGRIDPSLILGGSAATLSIRRVAAAPVEEGDAIRAYDALRVVPASQNGSLDAAMVLGIAANSCLVGERVEIIVMGVITKTQFEVFPFNRPIYLDVNGGVTDERPETGYLVPIAKSLANGEIMVSVGYPTKLGVA